MEKIRVTKIFRFEMAHALNGYDGACKNIHGHSYVLHVTVIGPVLNQRDHPKNGMVIDFTLLKEIVESNIVRKMDHTLLLDKTSPYLEKLSDPELLGKIVLTEYTPTSENLLSEFAMILRKLIPDPLRLHHLRLSETSTSLAEWYAEDNLN
jgi:6-pyruvoyltetrahydropterin/6-carboxytetrahydropterin synthase